MVNHHIQITDNITGILMNDYYTHPFIKDDMAICSMGRKKKLKIVIAIIEKWLNPFYGDDKTIQRLAKQKTQIM